MNIYVDLRFWWWSIHIIKFSKMTTLNSSKDIITLNHTKSKNMYPLFERFTTSVRVTTKIKLLNLTFGDEKCKRGLNIQDYTFVSTDYFLIRIINYFLKVDCLILEKTQYLIFYNVAIKLIVILKYGLWKVNVATWGIIPRFDGSIIKNPIYNWRWTCKWWNCETK